MCLVVLAYQVNPRYPFIVAATRDEFYHRQSEPIGFWGHHGELLAGRDLLRGGIWLGLTRSGRFAAVTNVREGLVGKRSPVSRGDLAKNFLFGNLSPTQYVKTLEEPHRYGGFHLLLGDAHGLFHFSNRSAGLISLAPGIHGVSNHLFNDSWPKTEASKKDLKKLIEQDQVDHRTLQELMTRQPVRHEGVGGNLEYSTHNPFLWSKEYGTCATSSLIIERDRMNNSRASVFEKRYGQLGVEAGNRRFDFRIGV